MQNFVYLDRRPGDADCVVVDPGLGDRRHLSSRSRPTGCTSPACSSPTRTRTTSAATSSATTSPGSRISWPRPRPRSTSTRPSASSSAASARPRQGGRRRHARRGAQEDHVRPHAWAHAGLAVLPRGRPPHLGRHALHPLVRPDGPARQRSQGDVHLADPAAGRPPGRHRRLPGHNYGGTVTTIGDEKREQSHDALPHDDGLPPRDGSIAGRR